MGNTQKENKIFFRNTTGGFTLIELMISIGVIAIISTALILTLNPTEIFRQTRDANRLIALTTMSRAVTLFRTSDVSQQGLGTPNIVYISMPDPLVTNGTSTCQGLMPPNVSSPGLPQLPSGWSYQCAGKANYLLPDGNGWLPINFSSVKGVALSSLPQDPLNSFDSQNPARNYFYTYATDGQGRYEFDAKTESIKYGAEQ